MPIMVLACQLCPKDVEATFYSFQLAVINLGYLISYQIGMWLMVTLGITSDNFDGLWLMILVASLYPVLTLFFMCCLLTSERTEIQQL